MTIFYVRNGGFTDIGFILFLFLHLLSKPLYDKHYIIVGENKTDAEYLAAVDLQEDLQEVSQKETIVLTESGETDGDGYV